MHQCHRDRRAHRRYVEFLERPELQLVSDAALGHQGNPKPGLDQALLRGQAIDQRDLGILDPERLRPHLAMRGEDELGLQAEMALPAISRSSRTTRESRWMGLSKRTSSSRHASTSGLDGAVST